MATEVIRPDADVVVGSWSSASLFSKVNEASPNGTVISASVTTTCELNLANAIVMGAGDICTAIQIGAYVSMSVGALDSLSCAFKYGAYTSSYAYIDGPEGSYAWRYGNWGSLSLTRAQVNDLRILLRNESFGAGAVYCDTAYVNFTYGPPPGWTHKFNGVANANIGKINGVLKSNVSKVNGV